MDVVGNNVIATRNAMSTTPQSREEHGSKGFDRITEHGHNGRRSRGDQ